MFKKRMASTPEQLDMMRRWAADAVPVERMAAELGTSHHVVRRWAREAGIDLSSHRKDVLRSRQAAADSLLRELYPTDVEWPELIRRYCEVVGGERSRSAVTSRAHDLGLKRPKNFQAAHEARSTNLRAHREEIALKAQPLLDAGMDMRRVAKIIGACRNTLGRMRKEGLLVLRAPAKPARQARPARPTTKPQWSKDDLALVERLWLAGVSGKDIGAQVGRSRSAVLGVVHRLGLVRRKVVASPGQSRPRPPKVAKVAYAPPRANETKRVQALLGRRVAFDADMGPAIDEWIAQNGVKRCPAAAVAVTSARLGAEDVEALRLHAAAMAPKGNWKERRKSGQWGDW